MADCWQLSNDTTLWNITFMHSAHDWEVNIFSSFFNPFILKGWKVVLRIGSGGFCPRERKFEAKHFFHTLRSRDTSFLRKGIWRNKKPAGGIICVDNCVMEGSN